MNDDAVAQSRKAREKLFKQSEILNAARKVFAEKGFEQATVEEIAQAAEFSKGALYNYFQSKEDIFIAILEQGFVDFENRVHEIFGSMAPLRDQLRQFVLGTLAYFNSNPEFYTILMKENLQMKVKLFGEFREAFFERHQRLENIIANRIAEEIRQGSICNIDPLLLVEVFWNIIHAFLLHRRLTDKTPELAEEAEIITSLFFDGISLTQ